MSMSDWAKLEVEIACRRENPNREEGAFDYGCACYESALKAYLSLMEDGHSGMSFGLTKNILVRLLEERPLTPIEDVPEVWDEVTGFGEDGSKHYQCKRLFSLFKDVDADGKVSYSDVERYYCVDADSGCTYHNKVVGQLLDEMHPITMPYFPPVGKYVFTVKDILTDRKNGDFDTIAVLTLKKPDGESKTVYRYFAEDGDGWREIGTTEFCKRAEADKYRQRKEAEDEG